MELYAFPQTISFPLGANLEQLISKSVFLFTFFNSLNLASWQYVTCSITFLNKKVKIFTSKIKKKKFASWGYLWVRKNIDSRAPESQGFWLRRLAVVAGMEIGWATGWIWGHRPLWAPSPQETCHQLCLVSLLIILPQKQDLLLMSLHDTKQHPQKLHALSFRFLEIEAVSPCSRKP